MKEMKNFKETDNVQIDFNPFGLLHSNSDYWSNLRKYEYKPIIRSHGISADLPLEPHAHTMRFTLFILNTSTVSL